MSQRTKVGPFPSTEVDRACASPIGVVANEGLHRRGYSFGGFFAKEPPHCTKITPILLAPLPARP